MITNLCSDTYLSGLTCLGKIESYVCKRSSEDRISIIVIGIPWTCLEHGLWGFLC